jgi:antitoxin FitA
MISEIVKSHCGIIMPAVTIRNLPAETHRALKVRAAQNGRSTEAEIRDILERAAKPEGRPRLGSLLADIGHDGRLTEIEWAEFARALERDNAASEPVKFD